MNKRTNKELQFTSVMPTMKKSLLALVVAGVMSASGVATAVAITTTAISVTNKSL